MPLAGYGTPPGKAMLHTANTQEEASCAQREAVWRMMRMCLRRSSQSQEGLQLTDDHQLDSA